MKKPTMNAVLYKDMQQKVKKGGLAITIMVINTVMFLVALLVMSGTFSGYYDYYGIDSRVLIGLFIALIITEAVIICFITPAYSASAISGEREKQTLDVLLTTSMSPWEIIKGKYFSSITQIFMVMISGLPIFALVFIYGGISFFQVIAVITVIMVGAMYLASFGILYSSAIKKTITATVLTYLTYILVFFATAIIALMPVVIAQAVNSYYYYQHINMNSISGVTQQVSSQVVNLDGFVFILYANPITTIFDCMTNVFGSGSGYDNVNMAVFLSDFVDMNKSNILLRFWTLFGLVVQLLLTYLNLRWAAKVLNPLRKNAKVKGESVERKGTANS